MIGLSKIFEDAILELISRPRNPPSVPEAAEEGFLVGTALPFGNSGISPASPVYLSDLLQSKHVAVFGASGKGKTTFVRRQKRYYYQRGVSVVDVDFDGDGADNEIRALASMGSGAPGTALVDLRQSGYVADLNLLGGEGAAHLRAFSFVRALASEVEGGLGVRPKYNLAAGAVALAEAGGNVTDFPALFSESPGFRRQILSVVTDETAIEALTAFDRLSPETQRSHFQELANKLSNYTAFPDLRLMLAMQGFPDLARFVDLPSRATLLALGLARQPAATLVAKVFLAAFERHVMARADQPEANRNPVRLFVDEASRVGTGFGLESLLAGGRRQKCALTLAMQMTTQAEPALRDAILANCSTLVAFGSGASEASALAAEVVSDLPREHVRRALMELPVGTALLIRRGEATVKVAMPDSPPDRASEAAVAALKERALSETGIPRAEAERIVAESKSRLSGAVSARAVSVRGPRKAGKADA